MIDDSKSKRIERNARAFYGLESPICDLKNMSHVLETAMEHSLGYGDTKRGNYIELCLSMAEFDALQFGVLHLGNMIRDLHKVYYAGFDEMETSDE